MEDDVNRIVDEILHIRKMISGPANRKSSISGLREIFASGVHIERFDWQKVADQQRRVDSENRGELSGSGHASVNAAMQFWLWRSALFRSQQSRGRMLG